MSYFSASSSLGSFCFFLYSFPLRQQHSPSPVPFFPFPLSTFFVLLSSPSLIDSSSLFPHPTSFQPSPPCPFVVLPASPAFPKTLLLSVLTSPPLLPPSFFFLQTLFPLSLSPPSITSLLFNFPETNINLPSQSRHTKSPTLSTLQMLTSYPSSLPKTHTNLSVSLKTHTNTSYLFKFLLPTPPFSLKHTRTFLSTQDTLTPLGSSDAHFLPLLSP